MCLAAGDVIRFFVSPDLKAWSPSGEFGRCGSLEGVWETPDLFPLPVDGGPETRWVLTVGVGSGGPAGGSGTQYFIGQFDGSTFTSENPPETILWMDYGSDFYAPQSWNEEPYDRRVMLGWMNNWRYANMIPAEAWRGMFSLPRELTLVVTEQGIHLAQQPVREIEARRGEHLHWRDQAIGPGENLLTGMHGDCLEILADLSPDSSVTRFGFRVRVGADEATVIVCDMAACTLSVDRTHSGQVSFADEFAAVHSAPLPMDEAEANLRILLDSSSVEVFAGHGRVTLTEGIFPAPESQSLDLFVEGGSLHIRQLELYSLS
ncbi:MAG: GH32 C-terminal domain-containing protein [Chloroflexi bacterium]|nr:GH32 C-terminal domain-containing protein [Chloroflexota bacterium]